MATAGSIVVDLLARTGAFDTDIQRSTKAAEKRMKEMQRTVEAAGAAMGVAMAAGAAGVAYFTKKWIDGLDALNDAADATGATIENLSALEDIAVRTGTSMDSATNALVKFNLGLKGTDDDGKAAKALEAIGLNIAELRNLDPAEALLRTAQALAKFADDGDKARLVQELFGKSVREMAPLLKDLADKGELVATVTTEQAKEAETFNKELFAMQKNVTDLGRYFATDLVIGINAAAKAMREGGLIEGLRVLFGGNEEFRANKKLVDLTDQLAKAQDRLYQARRAAEGPMGFLGGQRVVRAEEEVKRLEAELSRLFAERRAANPDMSIADLRRLELSYKPSIGAVNTSKAKAPTGPKGPDPDADFKAYLNQLEQQIQKVGELTTMEKLLDDIRRGHLTVKDKQRETLEALAGQIDAEKDALRIAKERQALRNKDYEDSAAALRDIEEAKRRFDADQQLRLEQLTGVSALKEQWNDLQIISKAFEDGTITGHQFDQALESIYGKTQKLTHDAEDFASLGLSAFQDLAISGENFNDVLKRTLVSLANLIYQIGVVEPLMAEVRAGAKSGTGIGGFLSGIGNLLSGGGAVNMGTATGADLSLFYADGGPVTANKPIIVGDGGEPEWFIPRTAGMIVPMSKMGNGNGGGVTLVNQTQGRVDNVVEQRMSDGERVLILQQAEDRIAARMSEPNSRVSQALGRNFGVRRNR